VQCIETSNIDSME